MEETGVRVILFLHFLVLALVARGYVASAKTKETRAAVVRQSILFWLASLFLVILGWAVTFGFLAAFYIRQTIYPDSSVWSIEFGVTAVLVALSALMLKRRLAKRYGA